MDVNTVLVRALADIIVSINLTDDEAIDPDVATDILEPAVALFGDLTPQGRREVASLVLDYAEVEEHPERKRMLLEFPEATGLVDED
jgi:hypothetical protein